MSEKPQTIAMSPVKSGQIAEIGHDGDTIESKVFAGTFYDCRGGGVRQNGG